MRRRVLVTGATGFIGRHALAPLVAKGFEVHAVSRIPEATKGCQVHAADLLDHTETQRLLQHVNPTDLMHLAWDVTPGSYWGSQTNLAWVSASLDLFRTFANFGGSRVVVAGTCAEYDWANATDDLEEDMPTQPSTLYGVSKDALRRTLGAACKVSGISFSWARLFYLYGPHEARGRLVPDIVTSLLASCRAGIGDGRAVRDYMHVADAASALATIQSADCEGAVNIASGHPVAVGTIAQEIGRQIRRPDLIGFGDRPTPPDEPARVAASGRRLTSLGFEPAFDLESGLADVIAWWRANNRL